MPKNRKTRKQKIRASIKQQPVIATVVQSSPQNTTQTHQPIKLPDKLTLQQTIGQNSMGTTHSHSYLRGELLKTAILSGAIIIAELFLFFIIRNHLIVLPYVSY